MKKAFSTLFSVICALLCVFMLGACGQNSKYAGTYKMVSISGTVSMNGMTTTLSTEMYEYYNIILNEDGTAVVESKAAGSTGVAIEQDGTWEYEDGKIKLKSDNSGVTVVEEMTWENDTITYVAEQSAQGMTVSMTIVLQKSTEA